MSRRDGANAVFFVEKPGPVLRHLRAPIVPKLGTHSYGQNLISIELNPSGGKIVYRWSNLRVICTTHGTGKQSGTGHVQEKCRLRGCFSLLIPRDCAAVGRRGGASHATPPHLRYISTPKERSQGSLVGNFRGDRA